MKSVYRIVPVLVCLIVLAGCQATPHVGPSGTPTNAVTHVVIMWLNDPSDQTALDEVLGAGKKLETIPGVTSVSGGKMLPSDRPVVDKTYDVAFVITFQSADDLHKYLENPMHLELKKDVLDRYVRQYLVYDFVSK